MEVAEFEDGYSDAQQEVATQAPAREAAIGGGGHDCQARRAA